MRALAVNHRYGGHVVNNVLFENIDIEGFWPRANRASRWLDISVKDGAIVKNICFRNICIRNLGENSSLLLGTPEARLDSISFKNIKMIDCIRKTKTLKAMNITANQHVTNICID